VHLSLCPCDSRESSSRAGSTAPVPGRRRRSSGKNRRGRPQRRGRLPCLRWPSTLTTQPTISWPSTIGQVVPIMANLAQIRMPETAVEDLALHFDRPRHAARKQAIPTAHARPNNDTDGEVPMIGLTTADLKKRSKKSCLFGSWRPRLKPASLAFSTLPAVSKVTKIQDVVTRFGKLHSGSVYGGWLVCTPCMMRCQAKSISRLEEHAVVRWRVSPRCEHSREP
jgi:hypothetical protein